MQPITIVQILAVTIELLGVLREAIAANRSTLEITEIGSKHALAAQLLSQYVQSLPQEESHD